MPPNLASLLAPGAKARNLDLNALLAIAGHEGASGGIGDGNHAFGAFQLNDAGGVLTGKLPGMTPQQKNAWAWSPKGINYALDGIAKSSAGLRGPAAVRSIATNFERPANVGAEISDALAHYGGSQNTAAPSFAGAPSSSPSAGAGGAAVSPLLGQLLSQTNQMVGLNSPQTLSSLLSTTAPAPTRTLASTTPTAPRAQGGPFKAGDPVLGGTSISGEHPTMGLAGFPAHDYFAPAGTAAVAPVTGKVVRLSGHDPSQGPTQGPHGPLGWSVYIQGNDGREYYLTHMGSRNVKVGETVKAGQPIGTVADYAKYGTPSHIHMGVT